MVNIPESILEAPPFFWRRCRGSCRWKRVVIRPLFRGRIDASNLPSTVQAYSWFIHQACGFSPWNSQQQKAAGFQSLGVVGGVAFLPPLACMRRVSGTLEPCLPVSPTACLQPCFLCRTPTVCRTVPPIWNLKPLCFSVRFLLVTHLEPWNLVCRHCVYQLVSHCVSHCVSHRVPSCVSHLSSTLCCAVSPTWKLGTFSAAFSPTLSLTHSVSHFVSTLFAFLFPACLPWSPSLLCPVSQLCPPLSPSSPPNFVSHFVSQLVSQCISRFVSHFVSQLVFHFVSRSVSQFVSDFVSYFVPHFVSQLVSGFCVFYYSTVYPLLSCSWPPALSTTLSPSLCATLSPTLSPIMSPTLSLFFVLHFVSSFSRFVSSFVLYFVSNFVCLPLRRPLCPSYCLHAQSLNVAQTWSLLGDLPTLEFGTLTAVGLQKLD